jgi:hypothetical protein
MPRSDLVPSASALFLLVKGSILTVESCQMKSANMLRLLLLLGEMAVNFLRESLLDPSKDNKEGSLSTLFDRSGLNRVRESSYRKNN